MKQLLIEIDEELSGRLEEVAPSRSRRRSEFIRMAIRKAIWELEELATREAYALQPDSAADAYVDPSAWEPAARAAKVNRAKR